MTEPEDVLPLDPALAFLQRLWELNHALERLSSRMESAFGVSAPQRLMVRCVGKYPGVTPGRLSRMLHLDPGTVSASLRRLERLALIERRRDPRDGRRHRLGLTPAGRKVDALRAGTVEAAVVSVLDGSSESDIEVTEAMLRRIATVLSASARGTRP